MQKYFHDIERWHTSSIAATICILTWNAVSLADDWPQWGGPQRDAVWREEGIVRQLPGVNEDGLLPRVWSAPVGAGYAGPAVADGRVFLTDRIEDAGVERVLCLDAASGNVLWKDEYPARYTISYPLGPRATPTVNDGRVYTLGAVGHLHAYDGQTGEIIWKKHLPTDFGTKLPTWGTAAAPLVDGDQLIVLAGGQPDALVVSFDKRTGQEQWRALEDKDVGYCPPMIFEFGGIRQLIVWHPQAVSSLDPASGKLLWQQPFSVQSGLTIPTPRKLDRRLFFTSFYNGPLMIDLGDDGQSPHVVWRTDPSNTEIKNNSLHAIMCTPVVTGKFVFGVGAYGELRCLDSNNGRLVWETYDATGHDRWWNAFLVPHEERIFLCNEQGELILAHLTGDGYQELDRAMLIEPTQPVQRRMTVWSHPAFAMRSVFARNDEELIRVSLAE